MNKILRRCIYYIVYSFFYILSLLPMWFLYVLADIIYLLMVYVIGYRKKVVQDNLLIAFPEKSDMERLRISKKFYHNFFDSFVEVLKLLSAHDGFIAKRFTADIGPLNSLHASGKSCQLHLGHTFNWEWGQLMISTLMNYRFLAVYMPFSSPIFEKLFYTLRTRNGNTFLPAGNMRSSMMPYKKTQYLLGLVADQSPGSPAKGYWLEFFGLPTPFVAGPEKGARAGGLPVVFAYIQKPKRGYYHAVVELATENAGLLAEGALTNQYARYLENVIRQNPDMWLWTHRRWKHEWRPEYEALWIDSTHAAPDVAAQKP